MIFSQTWATTGTTFLFEETEWPDLWEMPTTRIRLSFPAPGSQFVHRDLIAVSNSVSILETAWTDEVDDEGFNKEEHHIRIDINEVEVI